jgi:TonB family protein
MRCSACGARVDPERSFCQRCGSATFLDDRSFLASRVSVAHPEQAAPVQAPPVLQRSTRRAASRAPQIPPVRAVAGSGCLAALIRWTIVFAVAYYAYNSLAALPEVRQVAAALLRGEQVDVTPAVDAVRRLLHLPITDTSDVPQRSEPADPAADRFAVPASGSRVHEPGDVGVTAPRLLQRVPARYTTEALRQRIQGTVILRAIVEPDGTVSSATIVRSLDPTYGLDAEAVSAVKQWRFEPGRQSGEPARVAAMVTMTFALRAGESEPARAR